MLQLTFILCDSSGNALYDLSAYAYSRKLSRKRNLPATAEVVLPLESTPSLFLDPNSGPRLKVYRSSSPAELVGSPSALRRLCFYGCLLPENIKDDTASGKTTVTFGDPRIKFPFNYTDIPLNYVAQTQGSILWDLVARASTRSGATMLNTGVTDTSQVRDRTYAVGSSVSDLMSQMTQVINGPDIDVSPDDSGPTFIGLFNTYARQGSDKPLVRFFHGVAKAANCDIEHTYTPAITFQWETGIDPDGATQVQTYGTPLTSVYGLLERYVTESDAFTAATLLSKAQGVVTQYQVPQDVWTIKNPTPEAPQAMHDFDLGDTIRLTAQRGRLAIADATLKVDGFDLVAEDDRSTTLSQLTLAAP